MIGRRAIGRLPRPAAPWSRGPGRRPAAPGDAAPDGSLAWELWNFRTLFPDAGADALLAVKRGQDAILAREREAHARLWSGDQGDLAPGRDFFAARPHLAGGLVVSVHLGPYQLLADPWLAAGHDTLVLLSALALPRFLDIVEPLGRRLQHRGRISWASIDDAGFMRALVKSARAGRPVIAYLDGNTGVDGVVGTRESGLRYTLPGRDILVRTGLARLACRIGCPVHRIALRWEGERVVWTEAPTLRPSSADDPAELTRELFDWAFAEIRAYPEQWRYWSMLRDSSACFRSGRLQEPALPPVLQADSRQAFAICCAQAPRTARLILEHELAVWPGDVLADLSSDRFYPAAGLQDSDLDLLRAGRPTLQEVREHHGDAWLRFHGLRLCLLGAARLGA